MKLTTRQKSIIDIITSHQPIAISKINILLKEDMSVPTLNRDLAFLVSEKYLTKEGKGRATTYSISPYYKLFSPFVDENYFETDVDSRDALTKYNFDLIPLLSTVEIITEEEKQFLENLKRHYQQNVKDFPSTLYQKELERLTIEISWKSSQIEGNTYSLLETEQLFLEQELAKGKPKEDAIMLLNHKDALNYILKNKSLAENMNIRTIEEIHSLLVKNLGIGKNIRFRAVGVTGTAYKPLDNKYQIKESLEKICVLINNKDNAFEKALLAILLIAYVQPFEDGNKRTSRMISNLLLIGHGACPLSYRNVDAIEYKKAMLLFYEQNNLSWFKKIFIEQNNFAVRNYFQ